MRALKSLAGGIAALASAGILLCTGMASGQTFESVHGGTTCMELGRSVTVAKRGGYITVGETFSQVADCSHSNIYVARVRDDGRQEWSRWYDMGGDEYVTSIKEIFNDPSGNDGFIITGTTENQYANCSTGVGQYDIFLLRINYCGDVLWSKTYGKPESAEVGWDVVEAQMGNGNTNPGDLIVGGTTTYPNANPWSPRNGYLLRVNGNNGGYIWDGYYDGPYHGDDNFYAIDEAKNGDVVAAGSSDSYWNPDGSNTPVGYQGWLVRVDGNTGGFNGSAHGTAAYGGVDFEEFRSVRVLRTGQYAGNLVATGTTHSLTNADEAYLVQTYDHPCAFIGDVVFGNFVTNAPTGGYAVREIPFNGPYYKAGELIVTGYTWNYQKGRQEDAFLQVVTPGDKNAGTLPSLNKDMVRYGGNSMDWGWSVEPVEENGCRTDGFLITGFTLSPDLIGADQAQVYMVKTDQDLNDNCTSDPSNAPWKNPMWYPACCSLQVGTLKAECDPNVKWECMDGWCRFCYCDLGTKACDLDRCDCQSSGDETKFCQGQIFQFCKSKWPKRLTGAEVESTTGVTALSSVPNPVKRGNNLTLNYTLAADATMAVTVSDVTGREVHASAVTGKSGDGAITIGTRGWAIGTYMVSVKVGDNVTTTRMVVTE